MNISNEKSRIVNVEFKIKHKSNAFKFWILTMLIFIIFIFLLEVGSYFIFILTDFKAKDLPYLSIINFISNVNIGIIGIVLTFVTIPSIFFWYIFSKSTSHYFLVKSFEKWNNSKKDNILIRIIKSILGLYFSPKKHFYLKETVRNYDFKLKNYLKIFKERLFDIFSISFGAIFAIVFILSAFIDINKPQNANLIFNLIFLLFIASPFIISWVLPLLWTIKDVGIQYIDSDENIKNLSEKFKKSIVNRLLKLTGISFAFSFLIDYNSQKNIPFIPNLLLTFYAILYFMVLIGFTSLLIGIPYFAIYHEKIVNFVRFKLASNVLNVGYGIFEPSSNIIKNGFKKLERYTKPVKYPLKFILLFTLLLIIIFMFYYAVLIFKSITLILIALIVFSIVLIVYQIYLKPYIKKIGDQFKKEGIITEEDET